MFALYAKKQQTVGSQGIAFTVLANRGISISVPNGLVWKQARTRAIIWALLGALSLIILGFVVMIYGSVYMGSSQYASREHHGDMDGFVFYAIFMLSIFFCPVAAIAGAIFGIIYSFIRARKRPTAREDQSEEDDLEPIPPVA